MGFKDPSATQVIQTGAERAAASSSGWIAALRTDSWKRLNASGSPWTLYSSVDTPLSTVGEELKGTAEKSQADSLYPSVGLSLAHTPAYVQSHSMVISVLKEWEGGKKEKAELALWLFSYPFSHSFPGAIFLTSLHHYDWNPRVFLPIGERRQGTNTNGASFLFDRSQRGQTCKYAQSPCCVPEFKWQSDLVWDFSPLVVLRAHSRTHLHQHLHPYRFNLLSSFSFPFFCY